MINHNANDTRPTHRKTIPAPTSTPPANSNRIFRLAGIMAVNALMLTIVLSLPGATQALTLATTHQPEAFTELYFDHTPALPPQLTVGQAVTLTYHVTNHEAVGTAYAPVITIAQTGTTPTQTSPTTIAQTTPPPFYLATGQGRDLTVTFTPTQANATVEVTITLPAAHLTIHTRSQS